MTQHIRQPHCIAGALCCDSRVHQIAEYSTFHRCIALTRILHIRPSAEQQDTLRRTGHREQGPLELKSAGVLSSADDRVQLAIPDRQVAVIVQGSDVTGAVTPGPDAAIVQATGRSSRNSFYIAERASARPNA